ncbi:hypothetical protein CA600_12560 [Paenibacillus sp. VTT E-133280]|uniref:hypothetical protein n=1 Tax=Paenibacillus sp. VTT E-133280 TaxID=1986222 RepID=UPI000BA02A4A|nr:hypothetical protein [Paenibacillus sp. VTT E-133280]OZQ66085.1 hypothetical protein CA600_12560 [Paenibacillus sp. VTT E-133280]
MTRRKWYFYSFIYVVENGVGNGKGMKRFKRSPSLFNWILVEREIENEHQLPKGSVMITNYQPVTK